MLQRIALLALLLIPRAQLFAQATARPATAPARWQAHLVTFSPGREVWERFGHNALVIIDTDAKQAYCYDFGNFDFNEADFIKRFTLGNMRYWAERKNAEGMIDFYQADNREITRQALNFTNEQAEQLWKNLEENMREDRKYYHYDYYLDNCSTRIRDHIDRVTGGALKAALQTVQSDSTYRLHTRLGMAQEQLLVAGIEFALADPGDRKLSAWEECFLPARMMEHLKNVQLPNSGGKIVEPPQTMNPYVDESKLVRLPDSPPRLIAWFAPIGIGLGVAMALAGLSAARSRFGRWLAAAVWGGWGLFAGLAGFLLVFMWGFTRHVAAYRNENLLQLSSLAIVLLVLGPMAAFGRGLRAARWLTLALLGCVVIGIALKTLPSMRQDNWNIIAFALPATAGLFIGVVLRARGAKLLPHGSENE